MCHNHACTVSCAQNQGKSWTGSPSPSSSPPQSSPPWPPWPPSNTTATPDTAHDPPTALVHPRPRTTTPPLPCLHRPIHPPPSRPTTPTHHRPHPQLAHLRTPQLPRSHPTTKPLLMKQLPRPCIGNGTRPCRYRALAHQGSRCQRCQTEYLAGVGNTANRGYGGNWKALREQILERDNFVCHWCGGHATSADHVVLKVAGGPGDPSNLVAACGKCNSARNQHTAWNQHQKT